LRVDLLLNVELLLRVSSLGLFEGEAVCLFLLRYLEALELDLEEPSE
jgi:hypothetical protein